MGWRLAGSLQDLRAEVLERWPGTTVWTIGDQKHKSRASDHNKNAQGVVCAIDVLGRAKAQVIWDTLLQGRDRRIKYMIFDRKIVSRTTSPWNVRHYSGSNPHSDHIHVSVGDGPSGRSTGPYDQRGPWGVSGAKPEPERSWFDMATEEDLRKIIREELQRDGTKLHEIFVANRNEDVQKFRRDTANALKRVEDAIKAAPPGSAVRVIVEGPHEDT